MLKEKLKKDKEPYKLVFTEIKMPIVDGFQMSSEMFEIIHKERSLKNRDMVVQALTSIYDDKVKENYKMYGIQQVLSKPVDCQKIKKILTNIIFKQ